MRGKWVFVFECYMCSMGFSRRKMLLFAREKSPFSLCVLGSDSLLEKKKELLLLHFVLVIATSSCKGQQRLYALPQAGKGETGQQRHCMTHASSERGIPAVHVVCLASASQVSVSHVGKSLHSFLVVSSSVVWTWTRGGRREREREG